MRKRVKHDTTTDESTDRWKLRRNSVAGTRLRGAKLPAARMAKLGDDYGVREYPETESWINRILDKKKAEPAAMLRDQLGEENYRIIEQLKKIKAMTGSAQARLPFEIIIR